MSDLAGPLCLQGMSDLAALLCLQGMSDLAAPLVFIMRDEAEAFWCFAALMERLQSNFHTDSV